MVEVSGYIFICIYIVLLDLHAAKNITMPHCAVFGCNHHSGKYIMLLLKPEAVPTIFQHVPQPKASTTHKHKIKKTVKSESEKVSKQ